MGCDIHFHIEIRVESEWKHYAKPTVNRWYKLFEKLAGVRGNLNNAISRPKGLPNDLSIVTQLCFNEEEPDAHSMSWINYHEIIELDKWLDSLNDDPLKDSLEHNILHTYLEGNSFAGFWKYPEDSPRWIEDVRFVFWFDN